MDQGEYVSKNEQESFLGWTGFEVVPEHSAAFRRSIEAMFANTPSYNMLNNVFRRAGLVPSKSQWVQAWAGGAGRFQFEKDRRAHYTKS
mmetsp:Transcript_57305/g.117266  ORF Transcript_57305/g.117266 Transcript_57305/m.117266 type:complete len:89 (-) Transcript_57305:91-357(-)